MAGALRGRRRGPAVTSLYNLGMSETRDGDHLLRLHTQKMGKPLGTLFHHLWQDLADLHLKWNEYVPLFGRARRGSTR